MPAISHFLDDTEEKIKFNPNVWKISLFLQNKRSY